MRRLSNCFSARRQLLSYPHAGTVQGQAVDGDGTPIAGAAVALVAKQLRTETALGKAVTDATGQYRISYARTSALNLLVRATDATRQGHRHLGDGLRRAGAGRDRPHDGGGRCRARSIAIHDASEDGDEPRWTASRLRICRRTRINTTSPSSPRQPASPSRTSPICSSRMSSPRRTSCATRRCSACSPTARRPISPPRSPTCPMRASTIRSRRR